MVLAGPLATRILANLGAEVIKVESEIRMDSIRGSVPPSSGPTLTAGGWFNCANTGKLSATINTSLDEGKTLIRRLAATCDVVVDNLRPGVLDRMGLDYATLRALNPGIVVTHMPGCGRTGPWADLATFGNQVAGAAGLNAVTGFPGTPPFGLGVAFADFASPYVAASAVLAAIHDRRRTGLGQEIDVAQLPATIALLAPEWLEFARSGHEPERRANRDPNLCPHGVYPTRGDDRWLAIAVGQERWRAFLSAIARPDLATDTRFLTHAARKAHEDELDEIVRSWTQTMDRWEGATLLQAQGVAAAAVEDIADHLEADPCLAAHYQVVRQPSNPGLEVVVNGEPIRFPGLDGRVSRAPALGEHNEYVFKEVVGLSDEEFFELMAAGAIG